MSHDLPHRVSIRLPRFDYSSSNWYYVTICTHERKCFFGDHVGARRGSPAYIKLNDYGKIVSKIWNSLPKHHNIKLDSFQIMPNHLHGIIIINLTGEPRLAPTLGMLMGYFKSECTKQMRKISNDSDLLIWQRNYYEHIIRDDGEIGHIRSYIGNNPINWNTDKLYVGARRDSPV